MPSLFRSSRPAPAGPALLLALGLLAAPHLRALSDAPRPEEVSNPEITAPEVVAHIKYLASDELKGRGSGTPGNNEAGDYIAGRFKAAGLKPAGENGTFFQKFSVFTGITLGTENALSFKQGKQTRTLKLSEEFMPLSSSANASANAPVVFAGYGISQADLGYDDYKGLDVKGKIVIVLRHTPDGDDNGKFGPYAPITAKTMTAREKGAAGILLVTGPMGDHPENFGKLSLGSGPLDSGVPAAFVKRQVVEELLAPQRATLSDLQVAMAHGSPRSFALSGVRASMRMNLLRQNAPTRNVIGMLEGSDPKLKNEVVVIGAHYDHLGMGGEHSLAESDKPAIHHGADDNASGTAGVMELAQYFGAHREKLGRSVVFMAFSGEEIGLIGSANWVKKPTIPLERVSAMVNLDMIGRMRNDTVQVIGTDSSPAWKELLEEADKPYHLQLKTGGSLGIGVGGSDQQSFYVKDIPVLFFFTGVHPDYHRPSDTWDKIEAGGEAKLLQFVADTVERLSRLTPKPLFTKSKEQEPTSSTGFRVYLGTIPDYAEEVEGVALQGVRENSPADKAGIRGGDVIVEFDGKKIRNVQEYTTVLSAAKPNVPIKIVVLRKGERVTLTATPLSRN
jgi:Zn-dependent M28 family amino/carboxypeptidase